LLVATLLPIPEDNYKKEAWKKWTYELIRKTSVNNGKPVLLNKYSEIQRLAAVMQFLDQKLVSIYQKPFNIDFHGRY